MSTPNPDPTLDSNKASSLDEDLLRLAHTTALESDRFIGTVTEVAAGSNPDMAIPLLILALGELGRAGVHLGAIVDVVPKQRFEPDAGPEVDPDSVRHALANLLEGVDEYHQVADPLVSQELSTETISGDLTLITSQLAAGMAHYRRGQFSEALWWWQYSYLAVWGERTASALRALLSILAHLRLDVSADTAGEAAFDALHATEDGPEAEEG